MGMWALVWILCFPMAVIGATIAAFELAYDIVLNHRAYRRNRELARQREADARRYVGEGLR